MKTIEATIGILMIIGLSLAIGFGFYQTYDGKNLQDFAELHQEMKEELRDSRTAARLRRRTPDRRWNRPAVTRERLAHYIEYVWVR